MHPAVGCAHNREPDRFPIPALPKQWLAVDGAPKAEGLDAGAYFL